MSLTDRTKSILLQVALKEASAFAKTVDEMKPVTVSLFGVLTELHEELGINPDDGAKSAPRGAARRTANVEKAATDDAPKITLSDGVEYFDYRGIKELGAVKPNYPDFKLATNKQKSFWILNQGEPTEFAIENGLV